jgi:hypothetical protein
MSDRWQTRISEYLDGDLTPSESQRFEQHLVECGDCRTALMEIREVVHQAAQLPAPELPASIWQGVQERLANQGFDAPVAASKVVEFPRHEGTAHWFSGIRALAAAILLAILAGGAGYWLRGPSATVDPQTPNLAVDERQTPFELTMSSLPPEIAAALADYEASVAQLEASLLSYADRMDSQLYETIEGNLETMDRAIYEARVALNDDPQSEYLNAHLADSMMRKVRLLRQVTQLAGNHI